MSAILFFINANLNMHFLGGCGFKSYLDIKFYVHSTTPKLFCQTLKNKILFRSGTHTLRNQLKIQTNYLSK